MAEGHHAVGVLSGPEDQEGLAPLVRRGRSQLAEGFEGRAVDREPRRVEDADPQGLDRRRPEEAEVDGVVGSNRDVPRQDHELFWPVGQNVIEPRGQLAKQVALPLLLRADPLRGSASNREHGAGLRDRPRLGDPEADLAGVAEGHPQAKALRASGCRDHAGAASPTFGRDVDVEAVAGQGWGGRDSAGVGGGDEGGALVVGPGHCRAPDRLSERVEDFDLEDGSGGELELDPARRQACSDFDRVPASDGVGPEEGDQSVVAGGDGVECEPSVLAGRCGRAQLLLREDHPADRMGA